MLKAKQKTVMSSDHGISHISLGPTTGSSFIKQSDVLSLGKKELDDQCYLYMIDAKLQKKAKQTLLCLALGISTSGVCGNKPFQPKDNNSLTTEQLKEYGQLNPFNLGVMPDWTKVMDKIPTIEIKQIKDYLTGTKVLTAAQARTYRVTRCKTDVLEVFSFFRFPSFSFLTFFFLFHKNQYLNKLHHFNLDKLWPAHTQHNAKGNTKKSKENLF